MAFLMHLKLEHEEGDKNAILSVFLVIDSLENKYFILHIVMQFLDKIAGHYF